MQSQRRGVSAALRIPCRCQRSAMPAEYWRNGLRRCFGRWTGRRRLFQSFDELKMERHHARGDIQALVALDAQRLKRDGFLRAANQNLKAAADAQCRAAGHARIVAGERAGAEM